MIGWFANAIMRGYDEGRQKEIAEQFRSRPPSERIIASEAVFGFAAWLTTRQVPITIGAPQDCGAVCDLVKAWLTANGLPGVRDGVYPGNICQPEAE